MNSQDKKDEDIQMFKYFATYSDKGMQLHQILCEPEDLRWEFYRKHYHDKVEEITLERYNELKTIYGLK